jgi:hypothetical protein
MIFHNDNCEITETVVRHEARPKASLYDRMRSFCLLVRIGRTHLPFDGPRNVKLVRLVRLEWIGYFRSKCARALSHFLSRFRRLWAATGKNPGAAMTICALLLRHRFYSLKPSESLKYATLGLLFVNISVGGVLTQFASPPVVIVARVWNWDLVHMLTHFGCN